MIIELLSIRMEMARLIGEHKKMHDIPVRDAEREEALLEQLKVRAEKGNLPPELVERIYGLIFEESRRIQQERI